MKTRFGIILSLSLGLLSANAAQANDAVLGAILGGTLVAVCMALALVGGLLATLGGKQPAQVA